MEPVKGRLAELIAAETQAVKAPDGAKARNWAAVAASLGPMEAPSDGGPVGDGGAAATVAKSGALLKVVGGAMLAGAIATGVWASRERGESSPSVARVLPPVQNRAEAPRPEVHEETESGTAPELSVHEAPEPEPEPEPDPAPTAERIEPVSPRASRPRKTASAPSPEAPGPAGLAEELRLVESLRRAVARGDVAQAKSIAARHRREFPDGALVPDRLDLEASVHCAAGDLERGRGLAKELTTHWPEAPVSNRLKSACGEGEDRP